MESTTLTLFGILKVRSSEDIVSRALKSTEQAEMNSMPDFGWELAKNQLGDAFREMLDIKMADIFCHAFILLKELQKYLDQNQYQPERIFHQELANLKIQSDHHPKLEIMIGPQRFAELTFDVKLEFLIKSVVLKIQNCRIREISAGNFQGVGTIACRGKELHRVNIPEYRLPGKLPLDPGIQIPRLKKFSRQKPQQPPAEHSIAKLIAIKGPLAGRQILVKKLPYRMGRNSDNDLCIENDDFVSGFHASLEFENGKLLIFDHNSRNGTFINEKRVVNKPTEIRRGDHLQLGDSVFQIQQ